MRMILIGIRIGMVIYIVIHRPSEITMETKFLNSNPEKQHFRSSGVWGACYRAKQVKLHTHLARLEGTSTGFWRF